MGHMDVQNGPSIYMLESNYYVHMWTLEKEEERVD